jgi:NADH-quinone oxidoreductase subunit M
MRIGLLSIVIWLPILGGVLTLALGDERARLARWTALVTSLLTLGACVPLYLQFSNATASFQFVERVPWITTLHAEYFLGVDGISLPLILLTALMTVPVIVS